MTAATGNNVQFQNISLVSTLQILMWNDKEYESIPQESNRYDSNHDYDFVFLTDLNSAIFLKLSVCHFACNLNYRLDFHNCCLLGY